MRSPSVNEISTQQLKHFGLILGVILICFFGIILPLLFNKPTNDWPFYLGAPLLIAARFKPNALKQLYRVWMKIGAVLGWINTRILLALVYFLILTPIGLIMRCIKSDPMQRKFDKNLSSYRKNCTTQEKSQMEKPF